MNIGVAQIRDVLLYLTLPSGRLVQQHPRKNSLSVFDHFALKGLILC